MAIRVALSCSGLVACWLLGSCSLLGLDDLPLESCLSASDCYVMSHGSPADLTTCYRCEQGRCERAGGLASEVIAQTDVLAWLNVSQLADHSTVIAWRSPAEPGVALQQLQEGRVLFDTPAAVAGTRDCGGLSVSQYAADTWLGLCLDRNGCEDGYPPLVGTLALNTTLELRSFATQRAARADCGLQPARWPVLAVRAEPARESDLNDAAAVWLEARSGHSELSEIDACRGSQSLAPLATGWHERTGAGSGWQQGSTLFEARDAVAPRMLASELGYLVAYADEQGVRLRAWDNPDLTLEPALQLSAAAAQPVAIDLALGAAGPRWQDLLLTWIDGCGAETKLMAAVVRWTSDALSMTHGPLTLRAGHAIEAGPSTLHTTRGFRRSPASGGWAVLWTESVGTGLQSLTATRLAEVEPQPTAAVELTRGEGLGFPFLHSPDDARFAYGVVRAATTTRARLDVYSCQE